MRGQGLASKGQKHMERSVKIKKKNKWVIFSSPFQDNKNKWEKHGQEEKYAEDDSYITDWKKMLWHLFTTHCTIKHNIEKQ